MLMKTDNTIINWSNNIVIHGSQSQYFFTRLNLFVWKKSKSCSCFKFR